jgi:DNA-binding transcriptional LysR family regulator
MTSSPGRGAEPTALEWSDLAVILAVCRAGSLSGAARTLGQTHSTIFRRVNAIEDRTNVRFFERTPDGYKMTDAGRTALTYAERIEAEMHALSREVLGQDLRLEGKVRVTAPEGFMGGLGPQLFAKFVRDNPGITIEALSGLGAADLSRRDADLAIRATKKPPDASVGKAICDFRFAFYASSEYREQHLDVPLAEQKWCAITGTMSWLVPHIWKKLPQAEQQVVFASRSTFAVLSAMAEGMGAGLMPCYMGDADERLVRIAPPLEAVTLKLWILTHEDLRHTARVKALLAFLHDELSSRRALFEADNCAES